MACVQHLTGSLISANCRPTQANCKQVGRGARMQARCRLTIYQKTSQMAFSWSHQLHGLQQDKLNVRFSYRTWVYVMHLRVLRGRRDTMKWRAIAWDLKAWILKHGDGRRTAPNDHIARHAYAATLRDGLMGDDQHVNLECPATCVSCACR